jgi:hypothetical protein
MEKSPSSNLTPEAAKRLEALKQPYNDEVYGDAETLGQLDKEGLAKQRLEEASAYDRHMEEMAQRSNYDPASEKGAQARRNEFIDSLDNLNNQPSAALEHDSQMLDEAHEMNEQFDTNKVAEAKAHEAAVQAKINSDPQLRRVEMMANELSELKASTASLDADEATKQLNRADELEKQITDLLGKYEDVEGFDREAADTLLERVAAEPEAPKVSKIPEVEEPKEDKAEEAQEVQEVDETDPESQMEDIVATLNDPQVKVNSETQEAIAEELRAVRRLADENIQAELAARVKAENGADTNNLDQATDAHFVPTGRSVGGLAETFDRNTLAAKSKEVDEQEPQDVVSGEQKLYFDDSKYKAESNWVEKIAESHPVSTLKGLYSRLRKRFVEARASQNEQGTEGSKERKGLKRIGKALGAAAIVGGSILGVAALFGDKGPAEHVDSGTNAPANPNAGSSETQAKPTTTETQNKWSHDARTVVKGEGLYQTYEDMGIPRAEWPGLMNKMLHSKDPNITTYTYKMQDGNLGWSAPSKNATSVLESIQKLR